MKLSILVVNWNTKDLIIKCIDSVLKNPPSFDWEMIVVDNFSSDGSAEALKKYSSENVKTIRVQENLGFSKGNNLAFEHSSGDYIFLLNPDTEIRGSAVSDLVDFLEQRKDVGIVGPKLLNPDGSLQPSVRRFPDVWSSILVFSGLHRLFRPKKYFMDGFDYDSTAEVDQVMGAALLTRRSIIEKEGLFDEKFFLWYEEVDFCYRIKKANYKVMYYPKAEVMHRTAQSFSQLKVFRRKKTVAQSLIYYFKKNGSMFELMLLHFIITPILSIAWIMSFFRIKTKISV